MIGTKWRGPLSTFGTPPISVSPHPVSRDRGPVRPRDGNEWTLFARLMLRPRRRHRRRSGAQLGRDSPTKGYLMGFRPVSCIRPGPATSRCQKPWRPDDRHPVISVRTWIQFSSPPPLRRFRTGLIFLVHVSVVSPAIRSHPYACNFDQPIIGNSSPERLNCGLKRPTARQEPRRQTADAFANGWPGSAPHPPRLPSPRVSFSGMRT